MNSPLRSRLLAAPAVAALLCAAIASSCRDSGDVNERMLYSSIVTVEQSSAAMGTTFTFQRQGDSPLITLTDERFEVDDEKVGLRALLYYYPASGDPYASGSVDVYALGIINCDTAVIRPISRYNWDRDAIYLLALWRTGGYINLRMRADYSDKPRHFGLVVDSLTLEDPWPEAYLLHDLDGAPNSYLRESYASFDISNVWRQPSCQGLRIHVNDSNLKADTYEFAKSQL